MIKADSKGGLTQKDQKDGVNCHLLFGHLGNFKSYNESARTDCAEWSRRIENRP